MKLGLALPQLGAHSGADQIASFARTSEQLGYASLWVGDRVLAPVTVSDLYPGGGTPQRPYPPEYRLDEILDVLHELWTHNPAECHGTHFELPLAHVDLRPV
ncbi:MAG: hypothetical protein ACRDQU_18390 [Pseudonocardiaceae bacterium]